MADFEIRKIGFDDSYEFLATTCAAQEYIADHLMLKGTGANVRKMTVNKVDNVINECEAIGREGMTVTFPQPHVAGVFAPLRATTPDVKLR